MNMGTKWILLAEDDPKDVQLTTRALAESHAPGPVIVARDGAQALDLLRGGGPERTSSRPCVILLDLKMPKVNGLEVLREIKTDPQLKTIPVVMLTSSRHECDLAESYQLGANAYVVKPVSFDEFRAALREVGSFWTVLNELPPQTVVT